MVWDRAGQVPLGACLKLRYSWGMQSYWRDLRTGVKLTLDRKHRAVGREGRGREEGSEGNKVRKEEMRLFLRKGTATDNLKWVITLLALQAWKNLLPCVITTVPTRESLSWTSPGNTCNTTSKYFTSSSKYNPPFLCILVQLPLSLPNPLPLFWECILSLYFNNFSACLPLHGFICTSWNTFLWWYMNLILSNKMIKFTFITYRFDLKRENRLEGARETYVN